MIHLLVCLVFFVVESESLFHFLNATFDERGLAMFEAAWQTATNCDARRTVSLPILLVPLQVCESDFQWFWSSMLPTWEHHTFDVFARYIDSQTVVIDFGAWIGPTILFSAFLAKEIYAVEGDPVAFANLKANLLLNNPRYSELWRKVHILPAAVVKSHQDGAMVEMHSHSAGNSCSGLGVIGCGESAVRWSVTAFTLPDLFAHWRIAANEHVFIKMDVESYECELLPSFFSWFSRLPRKPTLYVSMHSQVANCTAEQYSNIAKLFKLYNVQYCVGSRQPVFMPSTNLTISCLIDEILLTDAPLMYGKTKRTTEKRTAFALSPVMTTAAVRSTIAPTQTTQHNSSPSTNSTSSIYFQTILIVIVVICLL